MKKLLFTIAGILQVILVMAQEAPMKINASQTQANQAAYKINSYNMQKQSASPNANKAWLIVGVEGSLPYGHIPGPKGLYNSMPYRAVKHL